MFHYRIYRSGLRDGAAGFKAQGLSLRDTALQKGARKLAAEPYMAVIPIAGFRV